jgi:hypothetical protein
MAGEEHPSPPNKKAQGDFLKAVKFMWKIVWEKALVYVYFLDMFEYGHVQLSFRAA